MPPSSDRFPVAVAVALLLAGLVHCDSSPSASRGLDMSIQPPVAERIEDVRLRAGEPAPDPYTWLRDDARKDPRVLAYLEAENAYTRAVMKRTEPLQKRLYEEMLGRIKQTDLSVPVRKGDYYYYSRTVEGKQYEIHCRRKGSLDAEEQVLLDENVLAEGHDYLKVGVLRVSPDHGLLAFSTDTDGSESFTLQFLDLRSGRPLPDRIPGTYYALEWAGDNRTVFYNTIDPAHRPYRLYRHVLGTPPEGDELVYQEDDEAFFVDLYKTKDERYLMLYLESAVTSEVRYLRADRPGARFRTIHPRQHGMEYRAEHRRDRFLILTNDGAVNFKLVQAPVDAPEKSNWRTVIAPRDDVKLDRIDVFASHLVVSDRHGGLRGVRVIGLPAREERRVEFPEPVYTVSVQDNPEFHTSKLRFHYESLTTPESVYEYDMDTGERELLKRDEVLGGYDPRRYRSERLFATAPDGRRVPISLVHREGVRRDGRNPLLLYGYGAYGYTIEPGFDSSRISLLDRGVVFAIAHVRGGGALGRPWYEDGKLLHKRNTFTDFIAAAEHLVHERYTSPERLAIRGGSAGGLLIGAVVNMRPELFAAAVANVPFVDVINTMLDPTVPLTVTEWEEWGDPRKPEYRDYMASYSPYDNVAALDYPDMLVTAGLNDPRVGYWEPAKWVAKLRATRTGNRILLLETNMDAGHGGASGRYDYLEELALQYAFILDRLAAS